MLYRSSINRLTFIIFILLQFHLVLSNKDSTNVNNKRFGFRRILGDKPFVWRWPWDNHKENNNDDNKKDEEMANALEAFMLESFIGNKPLAKEHLKKVHGVHIQESSMKQMKDDTTESKETIESLKNEVNRIDEINEIQPDSPSVIVSDELEIKGSPNIGTSKDIRKSNGKALVIHKKHIINKNIQSRVPMNKIKKDTIENTKNIKQITNIHKPSVSSITTNKEKTKNLPDVSKPMDSHFYGNKANVQENTKNIQEIVKLNDKKKESRSPLTSKTESRIAAPSMRESRVPSADVFKLMDSHFYGDKEYVQENIKNIQETVKLNDKRKESRTPLPSNSEPSIPIENEPHLTPRSRNIITRCFYKIASYLYKKCNDVLVYVLSSIL